MTVAALVTTILQLPTLDPFDRLDLDALHLLRSSLPGKGPSPAPKVTIIAIDETTYQTPPFQGLPKVMWTRQIALVQDAVLKAGAKVFAWDIILPTSATSYVADKRFDVPLLKSLSEWGRKKNRVVLGDVSVGTGIVAPYRAFTLTAGGTKNLRSLNLALDPDGVARSLPGFVDVKGADGKLHRIPAMAGELASRAMGKPPLQPPANAALKFPENPGALPTFSFADLVSCAKANNKDYFAKHFRDKVVLFGAILDIEDRKLASNRFVTHSDYAGAPVGCTMGQPAVGRSGRNLIPGVLIHATAVHNLINNTYVIRQSPVTLYAIVLAFAFAASLLALRLKTRTSVSLIVGLGLIWAGITAVSFRYGIWLPVGDVWLALAFAWTGSFLYRFWTVDRERATVRESFSRYLDDDLIEDIINRGEVPDLGGERREMTVFFSDIVAFSSLSEHMTPPELVTFLNVYFEIISKELARHGGIIERFVGDSVVALFGAPVADTEHAMNGVHCALAIDIALDANQHRFGLPDGKRVATRIGVNSGDMVVGNVGAEKRFSYTVMGDCVNLAARLESGGKQFGTAILVGDTARDMCGDSVIFRKVDKIRVVGRDKPVDIYEPLGKPGHVSEDALHIKTAYEQALAHIHALNFPDARKILETLANSEDLVSVKMLERLHRLEMNPPGPDWDRVMNLENK